MIHFCVGSSGHGSGFGGGSGLCMSVSHCCHLYFTGGGAHTQLDLGVKVIMLLAGDNKKKKSVDYSDRALKFSVAPDCNENPFMAGRPQISNLSLPRLQGGFPCGWPATTYGRDQVLCQVIQ